MKDKKNQEVINNLIAFVIILPEQYTSQVDVIYTKNIQKFFDRLSQNAINKLIRAGFSKPVVLLFTDYFQDRCVFFKM